MLCNLVDGPVVGVGDWVWLGVLRIHRVVSWKKEKGCNSIKTGTERQKNDIVAGRWASWQELEKEQRAMENPQETQVPVIQMLHFVLFFPLLQSKAGLFLNPKVKMFP